MADDYTNHKVMIVTHPGDEDDMRVLYPLSVSDETVLGHWLQKFPEFGQNHPYMVGFYHYESHSPLFDNLNYVYEASTLGIVPKQ